MVMEGLPQTSLPPAVTSQPYMHCPTTGHLGGTGISIDVQAHVMKPPLFCHSINSTHSNRWDIKGTPLKSSHSVSGSRYREVDFLSASIYALFGVLITGLNSAVVYKNWQIQGRAADSVYNVHIVMFWADPSLG